MNGDGKMGIIRKVNAISRLPTITIIQHLEIVYEESHIISFNVLGGEHKVKNYFSMTKLNKFFKDGRR